MIIPDLVVSVLLHVPLDLVDQHLLAPDLLL